MESFHSFADIQIDVLKEVGNIGTGHALTALSKLLNKTIDMQVPRVNLLPFTEVMNIVGGSGKVVIAIYLRVMGDAPGNMLFIIQPHSAKKLLMSLDDQSIQMNQGNDFNEMELSALSEIGNIVAGSYLSSLADFTKLNLTRTVPALAMDMAGAILDYCLVQYGEIGDHALLIDTKFFQGDEELEGHFFLIPDPDSFHTIFKALGVYRE